MRYPSWPGGRDSPYKTEAEARRDGLKHAERKAKRDAADVLKRQPRAYGFEEDGEFLSVEFTRNNGERVVGIYQMIGWACAPEAVIYEYFTPPELKQSPQSLKKEPE